MIKIPLTKGQCALIDEIDEGQAQYKWQAKWNSSTKSFYADREVSGRTIKLSRVIMDAKRGEIVDHINYDTLDNRRLNLRIVSASESCRNRRKFSSNRSGWIGVHWVKRDQTWRSQISVQHRRIHLGHFSDIFDAILTRDAAAIMYHGSEFAQLNGLCEFWTSS